MSWGARVFLLACVVGVAAPARAAGDPEAARRHFAQSQQLYAKRRYADALAELQAARAADTDPGRPELDYNIGLCLEKLDRPGEAAEALERFINARPDDPEALQIWKKIAALRAKAPRAEPPAPPPPPPPPTPAVVAEPSPPPPARELTFLRSPRGIAAISVAGLGVLALLSSAVTGGVALSTKDSYHASCNGLVCNDALYTQARSLGIATDVMIGVGVAAAATTLALVFTRPRGMCFALAPSVGVHGGGLAFGGSL